MSHYTVKADPPKRKSASSDLYKEQRTYTVTLHDDDGAELSSRVVPSVTTVLDASGGDKTQRLIGWAKKGVYESIQSSFASLNLRHEIDTLL